MSELRAMDVLRPYLWVAMAAFVIGYAGYMAVRQAQAPNYAETPAPAVMASASLRAACGRENAQPMSSLFAKQDRDL